MKLYRFSPIQSEEELFNAITHLHFESHKLCKASLGEYLPVAGNVGVFCHYDSEYNYLKKLSEIMTESAENWNQKYFKLSNPLVIEAQEDVPEATYDYLYIRKPDPYRHHVGDIDFYIEPTKYTTLKQEMLEGKKIEGARIFPEERLDMIELHNPDSDAISYVSNKMMCDLVKTTKSSHSPK